MIGKTDDNYLQVGIDKYTKRLSHFCTFNFIELADVKRSKKISFEEQKKKEGELILSKIPPATHIVLLDEKGKDYTSSQFAKQIEQYQNNLAKDICFVVGGPYGFSDEVYKQAQGKISFSKMTFSHQMIRLFFVEQLYRAYSIIHNLPYHHE